MTDENPAFKKRVKRQVSGKSRECFVATAPGFEKLAGTELTTLPLSDTSIKIQPGGVSFNGKLIDLMHANLHLRIANRILMRLVTFRAEGLYELQRKLTHIPWEIYLHQGQNVNIHVTSRHSRLYHSKAIAQRINQSITDRQMTMVSGPGHRSNQQIFVRLLNNRVTISIDSSGDPLFKRGLKNHGGTAPLRETLAAAVLQIAGYSPEMPLLDPMCGSGSFSIEAAMMAKNMAAGMHRQFAFTDWPAFQPKRWAHLNKVARHMVTRLPHPTIIASDKSSKAVNSLSNCISTHHLADAVQVRKMDFFDLKPMDWTHQKGLLVLNPPYGVRLSKEQDTNAFFSKLAHKLRNDFGGWQVALLVPESAAKRTRQLALKSFRIVHGGLTIFLFFGKIS